MATSDGRRFALELFSGTGTVSQALRARGWRTLSVDLELGGRPSMVADVRALPLRLEPGALHFLWASPPCTEFSDANPDRPAHPSLELVHATLEAVHPRPPRATEVLCPSCKAPPGAPCEGSNGRPRRLHTARERAFRQLQTRRELDRIKLRRWES